MVYSRFIRTLGLLLVLLLFVVTLHNLGTFRFIETPLAKLLHIGTGALYTVRIVTEQDDYTKTLTVEELRDEFHALQDQYAKRVVDIARLSTLQDEYDTLRQQIEFFSDKTWTYYTARVTGKHIDPLESSVLVFIAEAETYIPLGSPAITDNGIFIGTVVAIEGDIVSIRLLEDGRTKVGGALLNQTSTSGVLEGGFGKSLRMNFIPQNEVITSGDIVVTSGLSENIPYGLPIGVVDIVEKEPYEPFQSAVITPLVRANDIRIVSLIVDTSATP